MDSKHTQTDFRERKHVLPLHILHTGHFLFALLRFLRVSNNKNDHLGASSLFYNFISRGFRVWNLEFFLFRKNNCVYPLIYVIIC